MIIVDGYYIKLLKDYGNNTNPNSSLKLRVLNKYFIHGPDFRFKVKIEKNNILVNLNLPPNIGLYKSYEYIKSDRLPIKEERPDVKVITDEIRIFQTLYRNIKDDNGKDKIEFYAGETFKDVKITGEAFENLFEDLIRIKNNEEPNDHDCMNDFNKCLYYQNNPKYNSNFVIIRHEISYRITNPDTDNSQLFSATKWYLTGFDTSEASKNYIFMNEFGLLSKTPDNGKTIEL
jgi:hypothetical protein